MEIEITYPSPSVRLEDEPSEQRSESGPSDGADTPDTERVREVLWGEHVAHRSSTRGQSGTSKETRQESERRMQRVKSHGKLRENYLKMYQRKDGKTNRMARTVWMFLA